MPSGAAVLIALAAIGWATGAGATVAVAQEPPAGSVAQLRADLAQHPRDADLLRRLAAAQAAAGDLRGARRTIEQALAIAPDDLDVRLAHARILLWSGQAGAARREAVTVAAARPGYPDLAELQRALAAHRADLRGGVSASASFADVTTAGGGQSWSTLNLAGFARLSPGTTVSAGVERERRRRTDTRLFATVERRIGRGSVHLGGAVTPDAHFRERWSLSAGGELPAGRRVTLTGDVRHARYPGASVTVVEPAVRVALAGERATLALRSINLFPAGEKARSGAAARLDWTVRGELALFGGAATYPDTEEATTRQVHSAFAGVAAPAGPFTLRATAEYDRRTESYTRRAITLGLGWRFGR